MLVVRRPQSWRRLLCNSCESPHAELGHQKAIIVFCLAVHCGLNFYIESVLRKWTFKSVWYNGCQISRSCYVVVFILREGNRLGEKVEEGEEFGHL